MRLVLNLLFFASFSLYSNEHSLLENLSAESWWDYQDILVNGKTIHHGYAQSGESRYAAIKQILDQYERPIKVLDIGANNGYFSLRIAQDYQAVNVLVDTSNRLRDICAANTDHPHLIYMKTKLTVEDLKDMNKREHFDVILAFHVLHHVGPKWKEFADELFKLGDNVIIEIPPTNDESTSFMPTIKPIAKYLTSLTKGKQIASFPRQASHILDHMIWFCFKEKSDYPKLYTEDQNISLSFQTFRNHHGRFPLKEQIAEQKAALPIWKRHLKSLIEMDGEALR